MPEYDLPNWVTPPAMRATLLWLLEQHRAESEALNRFRSLQQRIGSRGLEAFDGYDVFNGPHQDDSNWPHFMTVS